MNERLFRDIQEYDRLDALFQEGVAPEAAEDAETAKALLVMRALASEGAAPVMPRAVEFRKAVMHRTRVNSASRWRAAGLALAAVLIAGFLFFNRPESSAGSPLFIDEDMLANALNRGARQEMVDYLEDAERLLLAMRDFDFACSDNATDMSPEKELAKSLLLKQKMFTPYMRNPEFFQARGIFSDLERILVDVNNLDRCTDTEEVEFINDHINRNRILGKIRLVAREIQFA